MPNESAVLDVQPQERTALKLSGRICLIHNFMYSETFESARERALSLSGIDGLPVWTLCPLSNSYLFAHIADRLSDADRHQVGACFQINQMSDKRQPYEWLPIRIPLYTTVVSPRVRSTQTLRWDCCVLMLEAVHMVLYRERIGVLCFTFSLPNQSGKLSDTQWCQLQNALKRWQTGATPCALFARAYADVFAAASDACLEGYAAMLPAAFHTPVLKALGAPPDAELTARSLRALATDYISQRTEPERTTSNRLYMQFSRSQPSGFCVQIAVKGLLDELFRRPDCPAEPLFHYTSTVEKEVRHSAKQSFIYGMYRLDEQISSDALSSVCLYLSRGYTENYLLRKEDSGSGEGFFRPSESIAWGYSPEGVCCILSRTDNPQNNHFVYNQMLNELRSRYLYMLLYLLYQRDVLMSNLIRIRQTDEWDDFANEITTWRLLNSTRTVSLVRNYEMLYERLYLALRIDVLAEEVEHGVKEMFSLNRLASDRRQAEQEREEQRAREDEQRQEAQREQARIQAEQERALIEERGQEKRSFLLTVFALALALLSGGADLYQLLTAFSVKDRIALNAVVAVSGVLLIILLIVIAAYAVKARRAKRPRSP